MRDKQIEEMAKDVCVNCTSEICASGRCAYQGDCPLSIETIKRLHRKGYRKASDVAPKSEVNKELQAWADLYADSQSKWEKAYEELEIKLANAKSDVAREIFEEIEDVLNNIGYFDEIDFRSLKKKYLGEDINVTTKESEGD